jgi:prepilin-type processing-associated H-X9-DG protein
MQFPSAGQAKRGGTGSNSGQNVFFSRRQVLESFDNAAPSVQAYILPFIEQNNVASLFNLKYRYDIDPSLPEAQTNQQAAKTPIGVFICPSTGRSSLVDAEGYGFTDYSAPVTVRPGLSGNPDQPRFKCVLNGDSGRRIGSISDGTSNTIAMAEDAGRADVETGGFMINSQSPVGGPPGCTWDIVNCGPNEETFSFHPGGANAALADGSVHFVSADVSAQVFAALMSKNGGEVVSIFD